MRVLLRSLLSLALACAASAHDYPAGGDCVRAHPERALSAHELAAGRPDDVVCKQRQPAAGHAGPAPVAVGCIGDSITAVGHTSGVAHHWPNQLQDLLDAGHGQGKYSVFTWAAIRTLCIIIIKALQNTDNCM